MSFPRPNVERRKIYICVGDSQVYISVQFTTIPQGRTLVTMPAVELKKLIDILRFPTSDQKFIKLNEVFNQYFNQ